MTTRLDDPCPHPARNGEHEVYVGRGGYGRVCRACGASDGRPVRASRETRRLAYVATRVDRVEDQRLVAGALARQGIELSYDWTSNGTAAGNALDVVGQAEVAGVLAASILVVLLPGGRGTHVELGVALGQGKPVVMHACDEAALWQDGIQCPFHFHPLVTRIVSPDPLDAVAEAVRRLNQSTSP